MKKVKIIFSALIAILTMTFSGISAYAAPAVMPDGQVFDAEYYAKTYPDVAAVLGSDAAVLYQHYSNFGKAEGRLPYATGTDVNAVITAYKAAHPDVVTLGMQNALSRANSYLSILSFSQDSLIEQLEFEGFTPEESKYAVLNCGANWNEQCAKKAQSYMSILHLSRAGLINQLKFEKFTDAQIQYGVASVGY